MGGKIIFLKNQTVAPNVSYAKKGGCERYKNPPEDENQRFVGYRKKYYKTKKDWLIFYFG